MCQDFGTEAISASRKSVQAKPPPWPGALVVKGQLRPPLLGEPGDLVVAVRVARRVEDRPRQALELGRWAQAGRGQRLVVGVVLPVDVEVAEDDQVLVVVLVRPLRPFGQPLGDRPQLAGPLAGVGAVDHVQGDEDEGLPAGDEADRVGGAGELLAQGAGGDLPALQPFFGHDQLGGEARLLHRDDVEAGDDLGDRQHVGAVAFRLVVLASLPGFAHVAEGAHVPGPDQQVLPEPLRRHLRVEPRP